MSSGYPDPRAPQQGQGPVQYPTTARAFAPAPSAAYPTQTRASYGGRSGYPAQGGYAPSGYSPMGSPAAPVTPIWHGGQRSSAMGPGMIIALCIVGFAAVWGLWIVLGQVGTAPAALGFVAALIPLAGVIAAVMWLDRWEPEPKSMLLLALLWGAGVSVVFSFYGNSAIANWAYESTGSIETASTVGAVISAPIVEETSKGLGVLLIFLLRRKFFDGVVDGIVYAAVVAAGFAFTENILYFGRFTEVLPSIFLQRGILSPFAHILFTACTGIALGIASRHRSRFAAVWLFPIGLFAAMLLHALWNGAASVGDEGSFFLLYIAIQVPLFAAAVVLAFWLRRQESNVIKARLNEYAGAGWFAAHEVEMVASLRLRSQARAWAARLGPSAANAMKRFQKDATSLAYVRQRAVTGRADLRTHSQSEQSLLASLTQDRQAFAVAAPQAFGPGR